MEPLESKEPFILKRFYNLEFKEYIRWRKAVKNCLHCWTFWSRVQNIHRNTRLSSRSNHYRHNTGLSKKKCLKMFHIFYYPLLLLRSFAGQRQNRIPQRSRVASHRYVNYLQVSVTNNAVRDHKDTNSPWKSRLHSVLVIVLALQGNPPPYLFITISPLCLKCFQHQNVLPKSPAHSVWLTGLICWL